MSNKISYEARPEFGEYWMTNGLTWAFVSVLALAASDLAETDSERGFAAWIASNDQSVRGIGVTSFDVSEMPWSAETFAADRDFLLRAIAAAKAKTGWERLGYEPSEYYLFPALDAFRAMVEAFAIEHACKDQDVVWHFGKPTRWVLCPTHRAYEHAHGCVLCHDQ